MPKRGAHRKSRQGCLACKKAHNKCDEQKPKCFNCIRLRRICAWPESGHSPSYPASTTQSPAENGHDASRIPNPGSDTEKPNPASAHDPTGLPLRELKLLHNYMTDASTTIGAAKSSPRYGLWSETVVKLGFEYPFLLRAVLSVSALRLAKDEKDHDWVVESTKQIEVGLKAFRSLIANDTVSNDRLQSALFAFSSLLVVQNFGLAMVEKPADPIEEFVKCTRLVRGVSVILANAWEVVRRAELAPLFAGGATEPEGTSNATDEDKFLRELRTTVEVSGGLAEADLRALVEAIVHLQHIVSEHASLKSAVGDAYASSLSILLTWPVRIPERVVEMIIEHEPHTLCLMAYFPRLLASSGSHWWLTGWDELLLDAVLPLVPTDPGRLLRPEA